MIDLLVAGAGPAGLATALFAAEAGLEVLVLDPRSGPIDKACGEGLMPGAVKALTGLGIPLQGMPFAGIRYLDSRRSATAFFRGLGGMGVRRTALQDAMTDRARQLGVRFEQSGVREVEQHDGLVTAGDHRARFLVAADGLHSPIRRRLGLDGRPDPRPRWGLRQHFRVRPWSRLVEVHWGATCEAYVTPVGPNEIGVAVVGSTRSPLPQLLQEFPLLSDRLAGVEPTGPVRGAGPLRQRVTRRVAGRVLLVGDAAGYVDALTGEGIAVSVACARSLVDSLVRSRPDDYEWMWRRDTRRYRWITESLLSTRRFAGPAIVPAAAALPDVFRMAVRQLAR